MKKITVFIFLSLLMICSVYAYETYEISESEFEQGYTEVLSPGDQIVFPFEGADYYVMVLSITPNTVRISVSENDIHPLWIDNENVPNEMKFELNYDDYYDIEVRLENTDGTTTTHPVIKKAMITIKKIYQQVPEGTPLPYLCHQVFTCPDGTEIVECEMKEQGCLCRSVQSSECPQDEPEPCEKFYTCQDGTEVQYCEMIDQYDEDGNVVGSGCVCNKDPEELCIPPNSDEDSEEEETPPTEENDDEPPIVCNGCMLDECVPIGYRSDNNYCSIELEFVGQKNDEVNCNNAYECESNICEKNQCGEYCEGCKYENGNCIPFGTRLENNKYCSIDKSIQNQKSKESTCNNNYECVNNMCVNDRCIEPSLIGKIIAWFKKLFG